MKNATLAQRRLAKILPPDLYRPGDPLNKREQKAILGEIAKRSPEDYPRVVEALNDLGIEVARLDGSSTFGIRDMSTPARAKLRREKMRKAIKDAYVKIPDRAARADAIRKIIADNVKDDLEEVYEDTKSEGNPLAVQVDNAGRGNRSSIVSIRAGELGAKDASGRIIPVLLDRPYAAGLTPQQFRATQQAARKGLIDAKLCCAGDTEVRMADGSVKRIDAIEPGDWVLGADRTGRTLPVRVRNRWDNGLRHCKKFVFRKGVSESFMELTATEDHKILSQIRKPVRSSTWDDDREIRLRPLSVATASTRAHKNFFHAIRSRGSAFAACKTVTKEPMAYIVGLMLGNGCLAKSTRGTYQLSIGQADIIEDVRREFSQFGLLLNHSSGYSYTLALPEEKRRQLFSEHTKGGIRVKGHLSPAKRKLKELIGEKLAHQKSLPDGVWLWDDESCRQLIAGLFQSDGCCYFNNKSPQSSTVSFSSTSLQLLTGLRDLLSARFGVHANSICEDDRECRKRPCYTFVVSCPFSIERLYELIADRLLGEKRRKLDLILANKSKTGRNAYESNKICQVVDVGYEDTFDLEVDHEDHMYVLASGLIISNSVASSGYANKTMAHAVHRLVVSALDDAAAEGRGLPVTTDDADNDNALLAADYGPFKRNTVITPKVRKALTRMGHDEILVRSPISSGAPDGGVLARDLGERNYGRLMDVGEFANLAATNALGESVTQATLNAKHNSNINPDDLEESDNYTLRGFEVLDKVLNPSSDRRGFAVHASADGRVGLLRPAPQGGQYVTINGEEHYIPQGAKFTKRPGELVEAGDQLTDGIPDHVAVTKHRGIGEGRRKVVEAFAQALKANGQKGHRRNIEILARGLLDRVTMTEEYGDYIPDDVVPYHKLEASWVPRETAVESVPDRAVGMYLEKPVLHYTLGTKIRPSMLQTLKKHGVKNLVVNEQALPFEPTVVRAVDIMQSDPDWMTRQLGGHQRRSFDEAVSRGRSSDTEGTSYIGSRAELTSFNRGNVIKLDAPERETNNLLIP